MIPGYYDSRKYCDGSDNVGRINVLEEYSLKIPKDVMCVVILNSSYDILLFLIVNYAANSALKYING